MKLPVIIEPVTGNGYRATGAGGLSVGLTAEGATAAEAIDRLADQVRTRVNAGAKLAELSVAADAAPWKQDAGYLQDEPFRVAMLDRPPRVPGAHRWSCSKKRVPG